MHACRRKIEMTPGAQSRNDTPWRRTGQAPHGIIATLWARATGSRAVAGAAGARSAALEAVVLAQQNELAVRPAEPFASSVAAITTRRLNRGERVEVKINDDL